MFCKSGLRPLAIFWWPCSFRWIRSRRQRVPSSWSDPGAVRRRWAGRKKILRGLVVEYCWTRWWRRLLAAWNCSHSLGLLSGISEDIMTRMWEQETANSKMGWKRATKEAGLSPSRRLLPPRKTTMTVVRWVTEGWHLYETSYRCMREISWSLTWEDSEGVSLKKLVFFTLLTFSPIAGFCGQKLYF